MGVMQGIYTFKSILSPTHLILINKRRNDVSILIFELPILFSVNDIGTILIHGRKPPSIQFLNLGPNSNSIVENTRGIKSCTAPNLRIFPSCLSN